MRGSLRSPHALQAKSRALSRGDYDGAKETALWYDQLLGEVIIF